MRYVVVIEKAQGNYNYSAYVPDLPGCVATGYTLEEVNQQVQEAIEFHIEGLQLQGLPIPEPTTISQGIEVRKPSRGRGAGSLGGAGEQRRVGDVVHLLVSYSLPAIMVK